MTKTYLYMHIKPELKEQLKEQAFHETQIGKPVSVAQIVTKAIKNYLNIPMDEGR